ncbi:unnamed protein product, partial [Nesidiocoris tenuis]
MYNSGDERLDRIPRAGICRSTVLLIGDFSSQTLLSDSLCCTAFSPTSPLSFWAIGLIDNASRSLPLEKCPEIR